MVYKLRALVFLWPCFSIHLCKVLTDKYEDKDSAEVIRIDCGYHELFMPVKNLGSQFYCKGPYP